MPVYDYVCNDCHKTFELILTLKEHEVDAKCPKCGSKNVEQEATAFYACLLYTSPSPRDRTRSRMPSSA